MTKTRLIALGAATAISLFMSGASWSVAHAADAAKGKDVYLGYCQNCHKITPDGKSLGPTLWGVVGRKIGSVPGYHYSQADQHSDIVWTPENLATYLAAPRKMIHGTTMSFAGIRNPEQIADLIAFLETLK